MKKFGHVFFLAIGGMLLLLNMFGPSSAAPSAPDTDWSDGGTVLSLGAATLPTIISSPDGELMAVYNQFIGSTGDVDPTDPVYRVSTDGGLNWSATSFIDTNPDTRSFVNATYDSSGTAHAVWVDIEFDDGSNTYRLWYSNYDGTNWSAPKEIRNTVTVAVLAIERALILESKPGVLDVIYEWEIDGENLVSIFHERSTDGGNTWFKIGANDGRVNPSLFESKYPVAVSDKHNTVHVVWEQFSVNFNTGGAGFDPFYSQLRDGGTAWMGAPFAISEDTIVKFESYRPAIETRGDSLYVSFANRPEGTVNQAIYMRTCNVDSSSCSNLSRDWSNLSNISGQFVGVNADSPFFVTPEFAASGHNLMLFFHGYPSGSSTQEVIFGTQECTNWTTVARDEITDFGERNINPQATISDGTVHIVYERAGSNSVYYEQAEMQCGGQGDSPGIMIPLALRVSTGR